MAKPKFLRGWNKCRSLMYRNGNPLTDTTFDGIPVEKFRVVLIKRSDCPVASYYPKRLNQYDDEPKKFLVCNEKAKQFKKLKYTGISEGFTKPKLVQKLSDGFSVYSCTKYLIYDGIVYSKKHTFTKPN